MSVTFKVKSLANTNVNSKGKLLRPTDKNHDFVNSKLIYRTNFYNLISSLPNFKKMTKIIEGVGFLRCLFLRQDFLYNSKSLGLGI